jgi:hypothetical protein
MAANTFSPEHNVHEGIVRMPIRNPVTGALRGPRLEARHGELSRLHGGIVNFSHQLLQVQTLAQVAGILDDHMRHLFSLLSLLSQVSLPACCTNYIMAGTRMDGLPLACRSGPLRA